MCKQGIKTREVVPLHKNVIRFLKPQLISSYLILNLHVNIEIYNAKTVFHSMFVVYNRTCNPKFSSSNLHKTHKFQDLDDCCTDNGPSLHVIQPRYVSIMHITLILHPIYNYAMKSNTLTPIYIRKILYATTNHINCLLYTSPSPRDLSTSRMPSSA